MRKTINTCDYRKLDGNNVYYKITDFQIQSSIYIPWISYLVPSITQDD